MNSLEDPAVQISIEDDEPDIIDNEPTTHDENHKHDQAKQRQQPYSPSANKRITRSTTNSLPAQISRYSSYTDTKAHQGQNYEWANFDLEKSLRKVKILP
jgi:hypothetical protein